MSETINTNTGRSSFRLQLLTTASALALLVFPYDARPANAADGAQFWIELGGQFDQLNAGQQAWSPPSDTFGNVPPALNHLDHPAPTSVGAIPEIGFDGQGKIAFQPSSSDWILAASVRYGRATRGPRSTLDQSYVAKKYGRPVYPNYVDTAAESSERHMIIDFQAGKDVGLGIPLVRSFINFGVRFAQFGSRLNASFKSLHPISVPTPSGGEGGEATPSGVAPGYTGHGKLLPSGSVDIRHSFVGFGPSISWDASLPVLGSREDGLSFDWNTNGAVLFGRQKTTGDIQTNVHLHYTLHGAFISKVTNQSDAILDRSRQVFIPNVGGIAGVSYHLARTKISLGYRADFFFGAIDGGVEARKSYNRGFFGPFATLTIGIGG